MRENLRLLLSKLEVTYAVDPVPVAATNSILVRNLDFSPIEMAYDERNNVKPYYGQDEKIVATFYGMLSFDVELQAGGAAGTSPKWAPLLQGCGMSLTNVPATSDTFALISAAEQSLTHYFHHDGNRYIMTGSKGSCSIELANGRAPLLKFKFIGIVSQAGAIASIALPAATYTGFVKPLAVNKVNTTFTLGGYAAVLESLTIDLGQVVNYTNRPNREQVDFTDRKVTGTVVIEKPTLAAKDYYTGIKAGSTGALSVTHGIAAGNRVKIDSAQLQLEKPAHSNSNGISMLSMPFNCVPTTAGNNELVLLLD